MVGMIINISDRKDAKFLLYNNTLSVEIKFHWQIIAFFLLYRWHSFIYKCVAFVTIGNSVTNIDEEAFYDCTGLTEIVSLASIPPVCNAGVFENVDKSLCTLKVPKGSKDDYRQADGWKEFPNIEEVDVTGIETVAAESMSNADITDIYDLNGRRRDALQPGVNIVKMSDGTTQKVIKR